MGRIKPLETNDYITRLSCTTKSTEEKVKYVCNCMLWCYRMLWCNRMLCVPYETYMFHPAEQESVGPERCWFESTWSQTDQTPTFQTWWFMDPLLTL